MKLKTHQATSKRFKFKKSGKIIKRAAGQNHFNMKETGKTGRNKKSDVLVSQALKKVMQIALPHSK